MQLSLANLFVTIIEGTVSAALRSLVTAETVVVAVLFHDELGRTEDS